MKYFAVLLAIACLTGCPQKTTTRGDTTVTQIDSGEASRLAFNFLRERAKLQAKVEDESLAPAARLDAQYQIDAMDSSLALAMQTIVDKLTANKLVYERDAQGREVYYLEHIRTPAVVPGIVTP